MMILHYKDDTLEAEKIVKTSDSIVGYNGVTEVFSFRGVSDFSLFTLENGSFETELSDKERIEALEEAIVLLMMEG